MSKLFTFSGRISRMGFWIGFLVSILLPSVLIVGIIMIFGAVSFATSLSSSSPFSSIFVTIVLALSMLAGFIVFIATTIRRFHDRDKSGWWVLVSFIPIIGLWVFIECGFLQGTLGANRFGSDPLTLLTPPEQAVQIVSSQLEVPQSPIVV